MYLSLISVTQISDSLINLDTGTQWDSQTLI